MNIDEIEELWAEDSLIDRTELGDEAIKIPKLHHKYYKIFYTERLILRKLEADMKTLKFEKREFYKDGPNEETQKRGWKMPAKGRIMNTDLPMYVDADPDVIQLSLRIGLQQEKVDFLDSIIKSLVGRGFSIKNAVEWTKFVNAAT